MNPIDAALDALGIEDLDKEAFARKRIYPKTDLSARAKGELEMWNTWDKGGRKPEHLRPLIHSLQPLVKHRSRIFENKVRDIPPPVIRSEFQKQLVGALETFDPNKGKMSTYVTGRLMKANRFINTYQNPARIVETRIYNITKLKNAEDFLRQQSGRSPTTHEIADYAKLPVSDVHALQKEVRRADPTGQFGLGDPISITPSRTKEIMRLLPYDLTPEENSVFERVYGVGAHKQMGTGQIAKDLKMSAPKVSRLKKSVAGKWQAYQG